MIDPHRSAVYTTEVVSKTTQAIRNLDQITRKVIAKRDRLNERLEKLAKLREFIAGGDPR